MSSRKSFVPLSLPLVWIPCCNLSLTFCRSDGERAKIWVYDVKDDPRFQFYETFYNLNLQTFVIRYSGFHWWTFRA